MGDKERADQLAQDTLAAALRIGDVIEQLSAQNLLGTLARGRGELDAAAYHYSEAIRLAESQGNLELVNMYRMNLGTVDLDAGRLDDARVRFLAVLEYRRSEGLSRGVGFAHLNLGDTEFHAGDLAAAEQHFAVAAEAFRAVGFKARLANALQGLAAVEARTGRAESAARRLGSAAAVIADTGWVAGDSDLEPAATAAAREALGDEAFDRLFSDGAGSGAA